jgi:alpha-tubulin suppressor-like RCC1 family protein
MAATDDGQVYTWGSGYKGKLGHFTEWTHADPAD